MILLPVDEAFALDYLAILYVKRGYGLHVSEDLNRVTKSLSDQINNWQDVINSDEFANMVVANGVTFREVSDAGNTPVQIANFRRFKAKQVIQQKFWPDKPMREQKRPQGT